MSIRGQVYFARQGWTRKGGWRRRGTDRIVQCKLLGGRRWVLKTGWMVMHPPDWNILIGLREGVLQ